ncbi:hypothetical protein AWZ03_014707, partial [Drosophila navojoa]
GGNYSVEIKGRLAEWEARFSSGGAASSMGGRAYQKSELDLQKIQESGSISTAPLRLSVPTASSVAGSRRDERSRESGSGGEMGIERQAPALSLPPERHPPWNIAQQVRKWGIKYDGRSDPLGIIEILEERAITYGIELDRMPRALSEVLVDKAAKWCLTSGLRDVPWRRALTALLQLAFWERILSRFGVPRTFVCDNGNLLMLERELRLPAALYDEGTPGSSTRETQPEAKEVKMREIFDSNLQRASKDQGRHYNLRRRDWRQTLGSAVVRGPFRSETPPLVEEPSSPPRPPGSPESYTQRCADDRSSSGWATPTPWTASEEEETPAGEIDVIPVTGAGRRQGA